MRSLETEKVQAKDLKIGDIVYPSCRVVTAVLQTFKGTMHIQLNGFWMVMRDTNTIRILK